MKEPSSVNSCLSARLERKLLAYAAVAGAAGAGIAATAPAGEARVRFTATHRVISPNTIGWFDLNNDGRADFAILNIQRTQAFATPYIASLGELILQGGPKTNVAFGDGNRRPWAMRAGRKIGRNTRFGSYDRSSQSMLFCALYNTGSLFVDGHWDHARNRFLGLRFQINGKTHYGWARVSVTREGCALNATLTGYAYETVPNRRIITGTSLGLRGGARGAGNGASLGHLAQGALQFSRRASAVGRK